MGDTLAPILNAAGITPWQLARQISPRAHVRVAATASDGTVAAENTYPRRANIAGPDPAAPFLVHLADDDGAFHLIAFDFDAHAGPAAQARHDAFALVALLERLGDLPYLVCESGPSGGMHVWLAAAEPIPAVAIATMARAAARTYPSLGIEPLLNPRTGGVRPPGAPHRHGGYSTLVHGDLGALLAPGTTLAAVRHLTAALETLSPAPPAPEPGDALALVDARGRLYLPGHRTDLGTAATAALHEPMAPDADASAVLFSALLGAVRARWRYDDVHALLDTAPGLEHVRTQRHGRGRLPRSSADQHRRLAYQWDRAVRHAAATRLERRSGDNAELTNRAAITTAVVELALARMHASPGRWSGNDRAGVPTRVPAVFDATGTSTVTGSTVGSLVNGAHPWTATGSDQVDFTITYANANVGTAVYVGSGGSTQDMVAGGGFSSIVRSDPDVEVSVMFQPGGDTQVPAATVAPGDALVDVFTPAAINGTAWGIDAGAYVPVTYEWALYDAGTVIPASPTATVPAEWTLLEQIQVVATGGPGVPITSTFTSTAEAGHAYVFVVSFVNANQPVATQGWFVADWADQAGLADEVIVAPVDPGATSIATSEVRGGTTVVLDEVTFTGFPADHGTFTGVGPFGADVATVQQRLWFFPADSGLIVEDANTGSAELLCDLTVPATNGVHQVDDPCATARTDAWGQLVAGTYVWTSEFAGDARASAFATSVTDTAEQVTVTPEPLSVTTVARQAPSSTMSDGSELTVWDVATVSGYAPVGSTIEFALYAFTSRATPVCDASTLVATLGVDGTFAGAGTYSSEHHDLLVPATASGLGFVATVRADDGTVLHEGVCGEAAETIAIARADDIDDDSTRDLAGTGADRSWILESAIGAAALILGAALVWTATRTRRREKS